MEAGAQVFSAIDPSETPGTRASVDVCELNSSYRPPERPKDACVTAVGAFGQEEPGLFLEVTLAAAHPRLGPTSRHALVAECERRPFRGKRHVADPGQPSAAGREQPLAVGLFCVAVSRRCCRSVIRGSRLARGGAGPGTVDLR
jgi:hypothetical protein